MDYNNNRYMRTLTRTEEAIAVLVWALVFIALLSYLSCEVIPK